MNFTGGKVISEGKLLEVMPVILTDIGEPMMLPPIVYSVSNCQLGFSDEHYIGTPITLGPYSRLHIPGSNPSRGFSLEYWTRIMEASPSVGVEVATVDASAVADFIAEIKKADQR